MLEGGLRRTRKTEFRKSDVFINGLEDFKVELRRSIKASKSAIFDFEARQGDNVINFHSLDPGAIVILKLVVWCFIYFFSLKVFTFSYFSLQYNTIQYNKIKYNTIK